MELQIKEYQLPERIEFNFEQIKAELMEKADAYSSVVYDDEHIKQAKADRAALNKLKTAINDERIRREKEYLRPFNEFKDKIEEIKKIIDKPIEAIDKQIKAVEDERRVTKREEIGQLWFTIPHPDWLTLPMVFNERWLNASVKMSEVEESLKNGVNQVNREMETLASLPEFAFEALEEYKRTLNINTAIAEGRRLAEIQKKKEEAEKQAQEQKKAAEKPQDAPQGHQEAEASQTPEPPRWWIAFRAYMTKEQAQELKLFFHERNITFAPVKEV